MKARQGKEMARNRRELRWKSKAEIGEKRDGKADNGVVLSSGIE